MANEPQQTGREAWLEKDLLKWKAAATESAEGLANLRRDYEALQWELARLRGWLKHIEEDAEDGRECARKALAGDAVPT